MSAQVDPEMPDIDHRGPTKHSYRSVSITSALVILGLALVLIWSVNSSPKLSISQLRVFDDSYRDGPAGSRTLTALHRNAQYYEITSTDEFLLALGFVISGYATSPDGGVKIAITLFGLSNETKPAWETNDSFSRVDDWKERLVPQRVGAPNVLQEFKLKDGAAIPVITVVQCAQPEELVPWSGSILIEVKDGISGLSTTDTIKIDLKKPTNLSKPVPCH